MPGEVKLICCIFLNAESYRIWGIQLNFTQSGPIDIDEKIHWHGRLLKCLTLSGRNTVQDYRNTDTHSISLQVLGTK